MTRRLGVNDGIVKCLVRGHGTHLINRERVRCQRFDAAARARGGKNILHGSLTGEQRCRGVQLAADFDRNSAMIRFNRIVIVCPQPATTIRQAHSRTVKRQEENRSIIPPNAGQGDPGSGMQGHHPP